MAARRVVIFLKVYNQIQSLNKAIILPAAAAAVVNIEITSMQYSVSCGSNKIVRYFNFEINHHLHINRWHLYRLLVSSSHTLLHPSVFNVLFFFPSLSWSHLKHDVKIWLKSVKPQSYILNRPNAQFVNSSRLVEIPCKVRSSVCIFYFFLLLSTNPREVIAYLT